MKTIQLHGDLARFGGPFYWDVASPAEAVRGLCQQVAGFRERLLDGSFHVVSGPLDGGVEHDKDTLELRLKGNELHFVPAIEGAGGNNNGFIKVVLGAALVATSFLLPGTGVAFTILGTGIEYASISSALLGLGTSIALTGVSQLLAPVPEATSNESPDKRPSFLFNSGINRQEAGAPVPLVFGKFRVGSVVASAGIAVEEVPLGGTDGANSDKFFGVTGR